MALSQNLDINEIIKSAYNTIMEIQQAATETVGTACLYARATPVINSEDVVLQEYTLTNVGLECPKVLQVLISNTDYNPGEYTIDVFGLNYVQPLEINITLENWAAVFGQNTMPQKGDILYVEIYNKLFEVMSSELIYTIAAMPTYYKCVLSKYSPSASRKETEEFRQSVEDLTVSQQDLFGGLISEEVADNNATVETSYNNTTYVDPNKDFDFDSIISDQIFGSEGNLISNAYYDFSTTETNVTYHSDLIYETSAERNHLIFSCWLRSKDIDIVYGKVRKMVFYTKDTNYWYFRLVTTLKLEEGDNVTIIRGTLLKVNGTIVQLEGCLDELGIAIRKSDMVKANKKLTKWYETPSVLKIYKTTPAVNIIRGYDTDNKIIFDVKHKTNELTILIDGKTKVIPCKMDLKGWNYLMLDISPTNIRLVVEQPKQNELNKIVDYNQVDSNTALTISDFTINEFRIENAGRNVQMCNIRLYENEYEMGDTYKLDMYSPVTRNSCKLILVDSPNVPNKEVFVTPVK